MSEESTVFVTMYYDNYEYRFGDGFYPCLKKEVEYDAETTVGFGRFVYPPELYSISNVGIPSPAIAP